ncbi:MAG TPA: LacI family DNA-binding transcriptional regulator [Rhodanobacteraceae bacterium]
MTDGAKSEDVKAGKSPARTMRRNPTMADLARAAGVSKITVSRALADSPLVAETTRRRIQQLARDRGYRLNVSARNFRRQRSNLIATIVEMTPSAGRTMLDPYPLALLGAIAQELAGVGYGVLLTTRQGMTESFIHAADGVILLGQGAHQSSVKLCDEMGVPLVVWGAGTDGDAHVIVGSDNVHGGASAAEHLLSTGRRRPVFVGNADHAEMAQRLRGFRDVLARRGIGPTCVTPNGWTMDAGAGAIDSLLADKTAFDAVFACSDLLAMGAIRALREHGVRVPEDVSVIGYDDTPLGAAFTPPLTSVRQNWLDGGALLARKILALVDGRVAASEKMPTSLIVRQT